MRCNQDCGGLSMIVFLFIVAIVSIMGELSPIICAHETLGQLQFFFLYANAHPPIVLPTTALLRDSRRITS